MDELTNLLIYSLIWWDTSCLVTLVAEHFNSTLSNDPVNYNNLHKHMSNVLALREEFKSIIECLDLQEKTLVEKAQPITQDETNEIIKLERKRIALEREIIDEQIVDTKEQQAKLIKWMVYPTIVITGLKLAWSLSSWLLPKAVTLTA